MERSDIVKEAEREETLRRVTYDLRERVKELNCVFAWLHLCCESLY